MSALPHPWPAFAEAKRRGDEMEADHVLDQHFADERVRFDHFLREELGRPDIADKHAAQMKEIDSGRDNARSIWHSISAAQRRALESCAANGGRLDRVGKEYRHARRNQPYQPVYVATIRALCAHELLAWDGGAFDPENAAVITERGRFVLAHGPIATPGAGKV